jgi:hypothetical protein
MTTKLEALILSRDENEKPEIVVVQNKDRQRILYRLEELDDDEIIKILNKEK